MTKTPHLGRLTGFIGFNLRQARVATFQVMNRHIGALGISPTEAMIMILVNENPCISLSQLSALVHKKPPSLAPALRKLYERGYLLRTPSKTDQRQNFLSITAAGRSFFTKLSRVVEAGEGELAQTLDPDERITLVRLLDKLTNALWSSTTDEGTQPFPTCARPDGR